MRNRAPKIIWSNLVWRVPMPLCAQTTRAADSVCWCSRSQLLAGDRRLRVPRHFKQPVLVTTSCPGGSPSSLPFVIRSCLSSFVSHKDGCVWRAWTEATSEGSFLKLRVYDGLKVEIMRKLIRLEMSARVYMCGKLGEESLVSGLILINF